MALKPDEVFVKDCLIDFFSPEKVIAQEGENPPDIYLNIKGRKIAVEITRLSPISFDQNGEMQNRNTQDYFGINLCDEINSKLKNRVPSEIDIVLTLHLPVDNPRKYKGELIKNVEEILDKNTKVGDRYKIDIIGSKLEVNIVSNRHYSQKKIVGIIVNDNSNAHLLSNAEAILTDRILDKVKKCKNIKHKGPKWLALFNDYWLADHETYSQAINNISIKHDFEKMFVISDQGIVKEI
jgi:hypothetical protein